MMTLMLPLLEAALVSIALKGRTRGLLLLLSDVEYYGSSTLILAPVGGLWKWPRGTYSISQSATLMSHGTRRKSLLPSAREEFPAYSMPKRKAASGAAAASTKKAKSPAAKATSSKSASAASLVTIEACKT